MTIYRTLLVDMPLVSYGIATVDTKPLGLIKKIFRLKVLDTRHGYEFLLPKRTKRRPALAKQALDRRGVVLD